MDGDNIVQIAFSDQIKNDLLRQANSASENHVNFASFVQNAEMFCDNVRCGIVGEDLVQYREIWFDLEVINALALADWESEGKPTDWLRQWKEKYKNDAQQGIAELRILLIRL